ncbi:MAG TPA: metalloregulator ArsR/SmtB family transcription factor [Candidatus Dormibacteraeota bacterium]|nr:metalloregulator ArsR/SmtB family transcription factor [Candidatus Dormibacteraeota bacterium]
MSTAKPARGGDPFEALGNPHRRVIVELIAGRPRSVQEIADELPISRPAVSRHLRVLSEAGLVADEQVGARRLYRLREEGAEAVGRYLERVWGDAAARFRLFAENTIPREGS